MFACQMDEGLPSRKGHGLAGGVAAGGNDIDYVAVVFAVGGWVFIGALLMC